MDGEPLSTGPAGPEDVDLYGERGWAAAGRQRAREGVCLVGANSEVALLGVDKSASAADIKKACTKHGPFYPSSSEIYR